MTVAIEDQDVRAVLVCHRGPSAAYQAEWTYWDSIEQAHEAETELTPCSPACLEVHSIVRVPNTTPRRRGRGPGRDRPTRTPAGTAAADALLLRPIAVAAATRAGDP